MKYYKKTKAAGKPTLTFAKWLGPNWKSPKKASKKTSGAAKAKSKDTVRTKAVSKGAYSAGLTKEELAKFRGK